jgi:hypothetical protein
MNKIPLNFDDSLLVGVEIEMICFNSTQIYIHFNNQSFLVIECSYYINSSLEIDLHNNKSESFFIKLIGEKVNDITIDENRLNLTLHFSNTDTLTLINNEQYESFTLNYPQGKQIF